MGPKIPSGAPGRRSYSALGDVTHLQGIELQFNNLNHLHSVILRGGAEVIS
jgi:hypothetical protein